MYQGALIYCSARCINIVFYDVKYLCIAKQGLLAGISLICALYKVVKRVHILTELKTIHSLMMARAMVGIVWWPYQCRWDKLVLWSRQLIRIYCACLSID